MVRKTVCDGCGAEVTEYEEEGFYDVSRYSVDYSESANLCEDCLPEEVEDLLTVEVFDN